MAREFRLPDIGEGLTEVEVVRWLVQVGERVAADAPLVELETDKALTEMPSPQAGVLLYQGAPENTKLAVGEILAVFGEAGETYQPVVSPVESAPPIVGSVDRPTITIGPQALPAVRKLAVELGVDLASVQGSGPGGRITEGDVRGMTMPTDGERVRMSPTRRAIAANLTRAWREIPHVTTFGEADATKLMAAKAVLGVPLEALLVKAVLPLLGAHPEFNSRVEGEDLVLVGRRDIGVAIDGPEGLVVAVIHQADAKSTQELGAEIIRLAEGVRNRTITREEMVGATFTVSNIGAVGGGFGTPIIPWGTSAILSVGRGELKAVVREDVVVAAPMFPLSLSYDHRIIDGALGRRFLGGLIERLQVADM